jgi:hypothetical protein
MKGQWSLRMSLCCWLGQYDGTAHWLEIQVERGRGFVLSERGDARQGVVARTALTPRASLICWRASQSRRGFIFGAKLRSKNAKERRERMHARRFEPKGPRRLLPITS